jgi:choline kinase
MNIIILADKYQKRMKSKGCVGLFEHKRKPLYVHQYEQLKKIFPKCNILYIYGFDHKRLEISIEQNKKNLKRDITFVYNQNYETFNDGASLSLVSDNLNEDTVLFMGDNVVNGSTFKKIKINESFSQVIMAQNNNYSKLGCVVVNNKV